MLNEPKPDFLKDIQVAIATPHDIPELLSLELQAFPLDHWSEDSFLRVLAQDPKSITLLKNTEGVIIGYVHADLRNRKRANGSTEFVGVIGSIAIEETYQGQGLGRFLLNVAIKRLHTINAPKIILQTRVENSKFQDLAISLGFQISGIIPDMYGEGQNAYEMELL